MCGDMRPLLLTLHIMLTIRLDNELSYLFSTLTNLTAIAKSVNSNPIDGEM